MGPVVPILMVASAAISAVGAVQAAGAQKAAAKFNEQVARQNAVAARDTASVEESRQRMAARKQLGGMRASYAGSGLGASEDVLAESAQNAEWDALLIRHGGEMQARGYGNEANLEKMRGKEAMKSGYLSAAGTLIGGAAGAYKQYAKN